MRTVFLVVSLFLTFQLYAQKSITSLQPNIIVFLVDDMGWQDCSVPFANNVTPFNQKYHTPNLERLAAQGMKFTNAYSNSVCTPTRVSFLTGMNAAHHRVTNWTSPPKNTPSDYDDPMLQTPSWNINGLSPIKNITNTVYATPLPELLKKSGYFTMHVGKAHWGSMGTPGSNPYNLGFMVNIAGNAIGHPQSYFGEQNYGNIPGKTSLNAVPDLGEYFGTETFLTDALTKEAIKAMDAPIQNKQPFFLHLAHYAIHTPIQGDKLYLQKYLLAGLDSIEAKYASLIEGMDKSLGDIMDYLQRKKVDKNTIIIFMSDNGGLSLAPPRSRTSHIQNLPLRAGKGSLYEGGIRVPMLVKWPGKVAPHSIANQYVQIPDFFPTILEIANIKNYTTHQTIDGKSFLPILKKAAYADSNRILFWHYPNRWTSDESNALCFASAIRQGNWKLVYLMKQQKLELYNLKNDLGEQNDLSAEFADKTKALSILLSKQLQLWNAQMPTYKKTGQPVVWPDEIGK